jgi:signal transduction histidine kinase
MVNDILDFAKIEAGRTNFEYTEFSLLRLVQQVSDLFSVKAQEKNLILKTSLAPELPVMLSGDSSQISRVLSNLVANAVKFTSSGEILIGVSLKSRVGATAHVRFEVRDTGPGIEASIRPLLFQPFNSFGAGGKKYEGSGLGLSICKQLIEQMKGKIGFETLEDTEGTHGSCFWFEVPLDIAGRAVVGEFNP